MPSFSLARLFRPRSLLLATAALVAVYLAVLHPWLMNWGATPAEQQMSLPGDELIAPGEPQTTRAVTIHAPADQVWQWIPQIGQDRAGWYSYTWLENLTTADIHNRNEIRPAWQQRAIGDAVPMSRPDILGGRLGDAINGRVAVFEPGRAMVLTGYAVSFVVQPIDADTTRLIVRGHGTGGMSTAMRWLVWDPLHFTMEHRVMLGIKARAEGRANPPALLALPAQLGWLVAGVVTATVFLRQRSRWPWLLLPLAAAAPALVKTGDSQAALAGFLAVGITIGGALEFGRRWWPAFSLIAAIVMLVLIMPLDAYLVYGLLFDLIIAVAVTVTLRSQRGESDLLWSQRGQGRPEIGAPAG